MACHTLLKGKIMPFQSFVNINFFVLLKSISFLHFFFCQVVTQQEGNEGGHRQTSSAGQSIFTGYS